MKSYKYVAREPGGARKEGLSQAASSNDVLNWLRGQGYTPVSVVEIAVGVQQTHQTVHRKRIKSADLSALCWQLTTMLEGGIPVTTALDTIAEDIENVQLQHILRQMSDKVKKGNPLSDAARGFPRVFSELCCALILAGETSGNLGEALRKLAEHFDSRDRLAKKVKGAIAYPIFISTFIVLIVVFIMAFIIPRFRVIFGQIGGKLPAFTEAFMGFYDVLSRNIAYIAGSVILFMIAGILISKMKRGHYLLSWLALATPLFGKILKQAFIATFCRTMSTLLAAGVSVLEALDILSTMSKNDVIRAAVVKTRNHIVEGSNISLSMTAIGFFPNLVVKMTQVGEESGSLPVVLNRTSMYYERRVDATITTLMSMLEPIMIVAVGAIVAVVVLALYLPIFTMSDMAK
ncbi:MAG: type II secretion system F family protein [Phycisphaerales bacterium]|nr:MAG: type II secretion system F family protein [Phycisphaerales bacterium]